MKWMKLFLILILCLLTLFLVNIGFTSWERAKDACYSWSAGANTSCILSFIPAGAMHAFSGHVLFSEFFIGQTINVQPEPKYGIFLSVCFSLVLLSTVIIILFLVLSFRKGSAIPEKKLSQSRYKDFLAVVIALGVVGVVIIIYLASRGSAPTDLTQRGIVLNPIAEKPLMDLGQYQWITQKMTAGNFTAVQLEGYIKGLIKEKQISSADTGRVFGIALQLCRDDYVEVLLKLPMSPDPRDYDKKYMLSSYPEITRAGCEKIYKRMGWAEGCEVDLTTSPCPQYSQVLDSYLNMFKTVVAKGNLICKTDSDCFVSAADQCGKVITISKSAFSEKEIQQEEQDRCRVKKLYFLCHKDNPGFPNCEKRESNAYRSRCENSVCVASTFEPVTMDPRLVPTLVEEPGHSGGQESGEEKKGQDTGKLIDAIVVNPPTDGRYEELKKACNANRKQKHTLKIAPLGDVCTQVACPESNPCCNSCIASWYVVDARISVPNDKLPHCVTDGCGKSNESKCGEKSAIGTLSECETSYGMKFNVEKILSE